MDYEQIRAGIEAAVPYNRHLGIEIVAIADDRSEVRLPDADHLHNHVGSQHAGALFSAGEAASGAAFVGAFADRLGEITPLAKSASIEYLKVARGPVTATGRLGADRAALLDRLEADGRVEFPVEVELTDGDGETVARMTVGWHVRGRR